MAGQECERSLEEEGKELVERLGGRWALGGGLCHCPAHDDRTPSLSIRPGRRRLLLHCFAGCSAEVILRALEHSGMLRPAPGNRAPSLSPGNRDLRAAALRIWSESRSLPGTPAEAYLAKRALTARSPELRYHPQTPHGRGSSMRLRPAMVAAVRDHSGLLAIHRTFLDVSAGSKGHGRQKCALGGLGRGAVRLGGAAPKLGLAEGIETALSATAIFDVPCWATLGSERFGIVIVPPEVEELLLFLDNDKGGRRAEALARQAFKNVPRIASYYPPRAGCDWNDFLRL